MAMNSVTILTEQTAINVLKLPEFCSGMMEEDVQQIAIMTEFTMDKICVQELLMELQLMKQDVKLIAMGMELWTHKMIAQILQLT